jgi:hypothetical protein
MCWSFQTTSRIARRIEERVFDDKSILRRLGRPLPRLPCEQKEGG